MHEQPSSRQRDDTGRTRVEKSAPPAPHMPSGRLALARRVSGLACMLGLLLGLLGALGCGQDEAPSSPIATTGATATTDTSDTSLPAVPEVDLSAAEPAVREQLEDQRRRVLELWKQNESSPPGGVTGHQPPTASSRAEAIGQLGMLYLTYGYTAAAEVCFDTASSLDTGRHDWPYAAGYVAEVEHDLDGAVPRLSEAVHRAPDDLPSRLRLAGVLLDLGRPEAARPHLEHALELAPGSAAAMYGMGRVLAAEGKHELAVQLLEQVLELQPRASSAAQALGLSLRHLGKLERAERALERGGDAPVLFDDPVLEPTTRLARSARLYLERAASLMQGKLYPQAAADYTAALRLEPENLDARRALAFCLQESGDLAGAISTMEQGLAPGAAAGEPTAKQSAEIHLVLAGLEGEAGHNDRAEEHLRKALELDPTRTEGHILLANVLARSGRLDEAVRHYDAVIRVRPHDAETLLRRATALINLGMKQEARQDLLHAAEHAGDTPPLQLRLAEALEFLGERALAARLRSAAASHDARSGDIATLLAEARQQLAAGRLDQAAERLAQVLELDPTQDQARLDLASILGHQGHLEQALEQLALVIERQPTNSSARHRQVIALLLLGRHAEARQALAAGLHALPGDTAMAETLARLLAASPDDTVRDGQAALRAARALAANHDDLALRETLAMAQAEAGTPAQAAATQAEVVSAGDARGLDDPGGRRRARLERYRHGLPWRLGSPAELLDEALLRDQTGRQQRSQPE